MAAALYGTGARLDAEPDLLFRLRAVDAGGLFADLDAALPAAREALPDRGSIAATWRRPLRHRVAKPRLRRSLPERGNRPPYQTRRFRSQGGGRERHAGAEKEVPAHDHLQERRSQDPQISGVPTLSLEHVPKKLLDFFDQDMLQLFDPERFLVDHVIPRDRETL